LPQWQFLLDKAVQGLERLRASNRPVPNWVLGGGTALMLQAAHRISKDIDAFIDDPQYLSFLSPRLGGEGIWACSRYDESPHHLKLVFPEGEIDFIVAAAITGLPTKPRSINLNTIGQGLSHVVEVEHPVEIALKKLRYRGGMLTVRDIFDVSVVDTLFMNSFVNNYTTSKIRKRRLLTRLGGITATFLRRELDELEIADDWRNHAGVSFERARGLVETIPG
jgi:hypothetical protein